MARRIKAVVAHDETVTPRLISEHIPDDAGIEITDFHATLNLPADSILRMDVDLLIVACREGSAECLNLIRLWRTSRGRSPIVVMSHGTEHEFVQDVFGAGADDLIVLHPGPYIPEQIRRDVEFTIRKAVTRNRTNAERAPDSGTVICVLGSKGGVGKTVAATNLGAALAKRGRKTVLVDLDLQFGDVSLALGLMPETSLFDLAVSGGSLDSEKLDDFMLRHPSGLRVLAAPARPDQAVSVTAEMMSTVYALLRQEYDFVIVDTPPSFTAEVIATVDAANWICMVCMFDALSLKNTRLGLETVELMGHSPDQIRVVLNRAGTNVGISDGDAVEVLGRTPDVFVPSDREITVSINEGVPVVLSGSRSEATKALDSLADLFVYTPDEPVEAKAQSRSRWRLRSRRREASIAAAPQLAREG
jgi:pilus assembly protein CpaE